MMCNFVRNILLKVSVFYFMLKDLKMKLKKSSKRVVDVYGERVPSQNTKLNLTILKTQYVFIKRFYRLEMDPVWKKFTLISVGKVILKFNTTKAHSQKTRTFPDDVKKILQFNKNTGFYKTALG